jgi:hypothetical protein
VVERLATDIQKGFPGMAGFSPQNIWKMRGFFLAWTAEVRNLSQAVRESRHDKFLSQPPPQSDLAKEIVRDPYNFDFLTLREPIAERELEEGLRVVRLPRWVRALAFEADGSFTVQTGLFWAHKTR